MANNYEEENSKIILLSDYIVTGNQMEVVEEEFKSKSNRDLSKVVIKFSRVCNCYFCSASRLVNDIYICQRYRDVRNCKVREILDRD